MQAYKSLMTDLGLWQIGICFEQIGRTAGERCVRREQRKLAMPSYSNINEVKA
jgi:hypothetical protein